MRRRHYKDRDDREDHDDHKEHQDDHMEEDDQRVEADEEVGVPRINPSAPLAPRLLVLSSS